MPQSRHSSWQYGIAMAAMGVAFAVAPTWAPRYYSNQNQYFLHGLAQAGVGSLANDWLANTRDPTPIFSQLVAVIARTLPTWVFQAVFAGILIVYFLGLFWWWTAVDVEHNRRRMWLIAAILIALHAAIFRYWLANAVNRDWLWYLQAGVAGHYIVGPGLQPSVFGVFLMVAFCAYAHGRPWSAILLSTLAAILHATYLLPAALFTIGVMIDQARRGHGRRGFAMGAAALVFVVPALVYLWKTFQPTNGAIFAQAEEILVNTRIPHHARIECWLDGIAVMQWIWIAIGVVLVRHSQVFVVALVALVGALALTLAQAWTGNMTLALLFPWRMSAILMPLATVVIVGRLISLTSGRWQTPAAAAVTFVSVVGGVYIMNNGLGYAITDAEQGILNHIAQHQKPEEVYFLPVRIPNIRSEPAGSQSRTFNRRPRTDNAIPWDFQRFRLATGACAYVDFKSIPYADVDVQEWYRRLAIADRWAKETKPAPFERHAELRREGVTHMILPADRITEGDLFQQEYADDYYRLYRLKP
jgi:hypothetical protein